MGLDTKITLITDIYNFINYTTSLSHWRGTVVQEKGLAGQRSGPAVPVQGCGLPQVLPVLLVPERSLQIVVQAGGVPSVSQVLPPFWL